VVPEDIKELVLPIFSKRVIVKSEHLIKGINEEAALSQLLDTVDLPVFKGLAE
jgi:MoxR-like ATPase